MAKIYVLDTGTSLVDGILEFARKDKIETARVEGVGAVSKVTIAYFNQLAKKYEQHGFDEFMEVTGLLGNITIKEGKPFLHAHVTLGRQDMSVLGGHLVSATVSPLFELVMTPTTNRALRRFNDEMGQSSIYKIE
jgi:predicted DNA-binding protein with PD1-like motif